MSTTTNSRPSSPSASEGPAHSSGTARTPTSAGPFRRGKMPKHKSLRQAKEDDLKARQSNSPSLTWLGNAANLPDIESECEEYWQMLTGRVPLPIDNGVMGLMETAVAIHTRACEIQAQIQLGEYHGTIPKQSNLYKFRTGPLRALISASERAIDLGSRRVTVWSNEQDHVR